MTKQAQPTLTINANFATYMRAKARAYPGLMNMVEKLHGGLIANMPEWLKVEMINGNLELFACSTNGLTRLSKFPTRAAFDDMALHMARVSGMSHRHTEFTELFLDEIAYKD